MAFAFYIPDQAKLLRKAQQQEQQILAMREAHWRYLVLELYDAFWQYIQITLPLLSNSTNTSNNKGPSTPTEPDEK